MVIEQPVTEFSATMSADDSLPVKYLQILSQGIEEVWLDQSFTDVDVTVDNKTYGCHKIVLASLSHYFSAMFRSGMKESLGGQVHIQNMRADTFDSVLRFIYTGSNVITKDNVECLLEAAVMLQITCLQEQCETFLQHQISPENCLGVWRLATSLSCSGLVKKSWAYILEYFSTVLAMEEFRSISIDDLITIINANDLNTSSEEAVCDAVIKWVEADPDMRHNELGRLFSYIRFPLISLDYIKELETNQLIEKTEECRKILSDMSIYLAGNEQECMPNVTNASSQFHYRQEQMLCVIGTRSRHPNPQTTEIKSFSLRRDAEYTLATLPEEPGACFAVCKLQGDVYVTGGYHGQTLFLHFVSSQNRWQHCSPMLEGRWGHAMVAVGGQIYILGGSTRISETLSSIECYDPKLNECKLVGGLTLPVSFMPVAAIGNRIYIFGGKLRDRTISTKIQCFDTVRSRCFPVGEMPLVSSTSSRIAVVEETIYIFYRHGDIMEFRESGKAAIVGSMPNFDHFGVFPRQGQILIVGCQSNQYSTLMFDPTMREMTPYARTINAALCNFHCMSLVISKQHTRQKISTSHQ